MPYVSSETVSSEIAVYHPSSDQIAGDRICSEKYAQKLNVVLNTPITTS
jgi:hypothetical protein